jgi:hypothetical protein
VCYACGSPSNPITCATTGDCCSSYTCNPTTRTCL